MKNSFSFIEPMMVLRVGEPPAGDWIYEMKFDGYRALAFRAGSEVRLLSPNRTLFNDNYPRLVDSPEELKVKGFTLDGEIAALDFCGKIFLPAPPVIRHPQVNPAGLLRVRSPESGWN